MVGNAGGPDSSAIVVLQAQEGFLVVLGKAACRARLASPGRRLCFVLRGMGGRGRGIERCAEDTAASPDA